MNPLLKVIQLHKNETQLIKRAVENDRDAQRTLFDLYAPKMLSVCRYYIRDVHFAEEVMLNGFFKTFQNIKSFRNEGSFEGWVRRIMVRECISYLRAQKKIEFTTDNIEVHDKVIDSTESQMTVAEIQLLIDNLPDGYRMVFNMYAIEGYKHHEIAKMLNITEGTSKSQLFKARKLLQEGIKSLNTANNGTN